MLSKMQKHYRKNRVAILAKALAKRRADGIGPRRMVTPEQRAAYIKKWIEENRDKVRAKGKRYRLKPDFKAKNAAKARRWRANNKLRASEIARKSRGTPSVIASRKASHIKRKAAIRGATVNQSGIAAFVAHVKAKRFFLCYYCLGKFSTKQVHFDHIIPVSRGGLHSVENLCTSCPKCNISKSNHDLKAWNKINHVQQILPI